MCLWVLTAFDFLLPFSLPIRLPDMLKKMEKKKVAIHCQSQRRVTGVLGFVVSVFAWDIDMNKVKLLPVYLVLQAPIILYKRWL
ncbi:hypothetical protein Goshw_002519 [Gossypium schwendimanii]|uniref:Uncharacterized protein n=2 Tax=Gossypium TaxID=3633 RepID=A0A7J9KJ28_GOSSC|nr:hypothetical protein [Gossypium schwendimanii]